MKPPSIVMMDGFLLYHKKFKIIETGGMIKRNNEALLAPKKPTE